MNTGRDKYWDILKGIGIISIVIGHCCPVGEVVLFVYSYHIALFFFISGALFNEEKYCRDPFFFAGSRLRGLWPQYFAYSAFFTLTNNLAVRFGLLSPDHVLYSRSEMVSRLCGNAFLLGGETLGGALWFIPVLFFALMVYIGIIWFADTFCGKLRLAVILTASALSGGLGILFNIRQYGLVSHFQTSLLVVPLLCAGMLCTQYFGHAKRAFRWYIALPCTVFLVWALFFQKWQIELSSNLIGTPLAFYPMSLCGIYLCGWLAKQAERVSFLSRGLAFLGHYSFDIMALHFLVFKLIDRVAGKLLGVGADVFTVFPKAFGKLFPVYLIAGLLLPALFGWGIRCLYAIIRKKTVLGTSQKAISAQ